MKYLPLLALGLLTTPAFADDVNVKVTPIPNEVASVGPAGIICHLSGDPMIDGACRAEQARRAQAQAGATRMLLVDDVNVKAKPLANETAIPGTVIVGLTCTVQSDASVNGCKVAEGDKSSPHDAQAAIEAANGNIHVAGAFVAGYSTHLKVTLNVGHALPLLPIR